MVGKLLQASDDAIDLSMVDPNTGIAAMQTADEAYQNVSRAISELVGAQERAAEVGLAQISDSESRSLVVSLALLGVAVIVSITLAVVCGRNTTRQLASTIASVDAFAEGDLGKPFHTRGADEVGDLLRSLERMRVKLVGMMTVIKESSQSIQTATSEIAAGSFDLSGRTEETAANLQRTSEAVRALSAAIKLTLSSAGQANQLAAGASEVADKGGQVVDQVVTTMGDISGASRRIGDIIAVIDGIAFQTNILALNAAVEAARAGEQGRGFAVVAGEVRGLAQRSATAAKEINVLIADSVSKVSAGSTLVASAGSTMSDIVDQVRKMSALIGEISSSMIEQSSGIEQVESVVGQVDEMTQQNAALVEQSAAAAESLRFQTERMNESVSAFRLS